MPEQLIVKDSVLEGVKKVGDNDFNLFKLTVENGQGIEITDVECWRRLDGDPILIGEELIADVLNLNKGRKKIQIDWTATNAHRQNGGGANDLPPVSDAGSVQGSPNTTTQPQQQPTYSQAQDARQESIEFQAAQKVAIEYARLIAENSGTVPTIEEINDYTLRFKR
jgi:hypothetical protein